MPMVIRRAIRCGVRAGRFFNGRWRDKFLSSRAQKDAAFRLSRDAAFFHLQQNTVDSCCCCLSVLGIHCHLLSLKGEDSYGLSLVFARGRRWVPPTTALLQRRTT